MRSAPFSLSHALSCRKGGLIIRRHNEVRDAIGDLSSLLWNQIKKEPVIREVDDVIGSPALIGDLAIRGVWMPQVEALFNVRIIDTDAQSYSKHSPREVIKSAEKDKKDKYVEACEARSVFTPLCCAVDGMLGKEVEVFIKGEGLSNKWDKSYSNCGWMDQS